MENELDEILIGVKTEDMENDLEEILIRGKNLQILITRIEHCLKLVSAIFCFFTK